MTSRWDVTLGGRDHTISVERGENGKHVIRVDGKTAARPLGDEELERRFSVVGHEYVLTRTAANAFEVTPSKVMSTQTQAPVPDVALATMQKSGSLQPFVKYAWVIVIGVVAVMMWVAVGPSYPKRAAKRVETMLFDIKDGGFGESAVSRGIWQRNVRTLDTIELASADKAFMEWRSEKGLTNAFKTYRIVKTENVKGTDVPTALVTFEAGGQQYKVLVPEGQRIRWAD